MAEAHRCLVVVVALLALVAACDGGQSGNRVAGGEFAPSCMASPQVPPDNALKGDALGAELWALPIGPWPAEAGKPLKIVVRMTGSGDLSVVALGPDGSRHEPTHGPTRHYGSNFERPGDEWGAFFRFDEPGCWEILATRATRGDVEGSIHLRVEGK